MLLCDRDCGESLNLLLVCRWGAGVLKLIEELKDKKEECPEVGGHGSPWGGGLGTPHLPSSAELQISRPRPLHFRVPKVHSSVQAAVRRTQASFRGGIRGLAGAVGHQRTRQGASGAQSSAPVLL